MLRVPHPLIRDSSADSSQSLSTRTFRVSVRPALDGVRGLSRFSCSKILLASLALILAACDSAPSVPTPLPSATATTAVGAALATAIQLPPTLTTAPTNAVTPGNTPAATSSATSTSASTPLPTHTTTPPVTPLGATPTPTRNFSTPLPALTPLPSPTLAPSATPLPTFAVPAGFTTETPAPDYLSWARPGPYRSPYQNQFNIESFSSAQPLVTTYFFYWFDPLGLKGGTPPRNGTYPYQPVDANIMSFVNPDWYEHEFTDMLAAGIDFVLPDYWGEPGQYARRVAPAPAYNYFATEGLPPMITALQRLRAQGKTLKVGLFLDTTILNDEDLTTERGKQIFYVSIRDYYARIPPELWAAIDNKPVVWIYDAQKVGNFNQSSFDYVYDHFAQDFGGLKPYIVREWQWYQERGATNNVIKTEGMYGWGAAPNGFNVDTRFTVAEVGPGFGNTQFGGSGRLFTDRQNGKYYEDQLKSALRSKRKILAVETWNELGESSGILDTVEFGRKYIDLTRKYVDLFKAGKIP
jgi:uncharacterized protein DUF5010